MRRITGGVICLLLTVCMGGPALSGPNSRSRAVKATVVLVGMVRCCRTEAWPAAEARTAAELRTLGFTVHTLAGRALTERDRRLELQRLAKAHGAAAAVRIVRPGLGAAGTAELWLVDRATGKTTIRRVLLSERGKQGAGVLALRVVELLRLSLGELHTTPTPLDSKTSSKVLNLLRRTAVRPQGTGTPGHRRPAPWSLRLALGAHGGPGGVPARSVIQGALGWQPLGWLTLELEATAALWGEDLSHNGARVGLDFVWARAWLRWEIQPRGRWRPSIGVGGGVLWLKVRGLGSPDYLDRTEQVLAGDLAGTAQLGVVLSRHVWLRATILVGGLLPHVAIQFDGVQVARFGALYLSGTLGVELHFL